MALPAHQLDAFHAVAETGSFSRAARRLGVTQPALSQRIQQLEAELKRRLFVRGPTGVTVTEAGARLLRYCEVRRALESEVLDDLAVEKPGDAALAGTVRIAAYSSIGRSCVLPAIARLFQENPRLMADFLVREMTELDALLAQGSHEIVILDYVKSRPDVEHVTLGHEELVLVHRKGAREDLYLDHDPDDLTTREYLADNGVKTNYVRRSYFDDVYGVLDAAAEGFGRAVVPRHLLVGAYAEKLSLVPGMKPKRTPVVMHHFRQPSYTRAHEAVRTALLEGVPRMLGMRGSE